MGILGGSWGDPRGIDPGGDPGGILGGSWGDPGGILGENTCGEPSSTFRGKMEFPQINKKTGLGPPPSRKRSHYGPFGKITANRVIRCYMVLYAAICRHTLLYAAIRCHTLLYAAVYRYTLLYVATRCYMLLYAARCRYTLLYAAIRSYTPQ